MDVKLACNSCYLHVSKQHEVEDVATKIKRYCECEEEYDLDSARYGYYQAPRTVYRCQFCPKDSHCFVHDMHQIRVLQEKPTNTSLSTS